MTINRTGCTRIVVLVGRWAVKFPNFCDGWKLFLVGLLANMQERQFSKAGWPELCPVLFSIPGGWLVVMPRVQLLTDVEFLQHVKTVPCHEWKELWDVGGEEYQVPVELKSNSFGWYQDRIVAIDYGN